MLIPVLLSLTAPAEAFCGFYVSGADASLYNDATMVVLMRDGTRTVLSMQNNYQGPPTDFAMVVPVPEVLEEDNVKTLPADIFQRVDALAAPRLVEYWEVDPCQPPIPPPMAMPSPRRKTTRAAAPRPQADLGVTIEAEFTVGEYEIVILSAKDSGGLDTWLKQNRYNIPDGAEPVLRPYVEQGTKFFVAKVDPKKVKFEAQRAVLSPLRIHYNSEDFNLPVRLGLLNSKGEQDLLVHILARGQRYEVANYDNAFIPTNIRVFEPVRENFGPFYQQLFNETIRDKPRTVVTEYSWDASTCDPCPTPSLRPNELYTLGADVITGSSPPPSSPGPRMRRPMPSGFVLTRLHYRYTKDDLNEDLVFQAAPPVIGGRGTPNAKGEFTEQGTQSASTNMFQGRYAILHPWDGPIECENPRRGMWGGPPSGNNPGTRTSANGLNPPPKATIRLASVIDPGDLPSLNLNALEPAPEPTPEPTPDKVAPGANTEDEPGCAAAHAPAALWVLGALGLLWRRRRG